MGKRKKEKKSREAEKRRQQEHEAQARHGRQINGYLDRQFVARLQRTA